MQSWLATATVNVHETLLASSTVVSIAVSVGVAITKIVNQDTTTSWHRQEQWRPACSDKWNNLPHRTAHSAQLSPRGDASRILMTSFRRRYCRRRVAGVMTSLSRRPVILQASSLPAAHAQMRRFNGRTDGRTDAFWWRPRRHQAIAMPTAAINRVEVCGNRFFVPNPSHFSDFIPIPITLPFPSET